MIESDDDLAPVIPLFGGNRASASRRSVVERGEASSDSSPGRSHPAYGAAHPGVHAPRDGAPSEVDVRDEGEDELDAASVDAASALDAAVRALARRDMSQRELERFLREKDFDEPAVADAIRDVQDHGYQDDIGFAQTLVGRLQERKGLGRTAIAAELARRMFSPAAISYALELIDTGDKLARAREVAAKRAGQLRGLDRETAARRLTGYLQRRGYSGSTVRSAVDAALPATGTAGRTVRFE